MSPAIETLNSVPDKNIFTLHFLQSLSKIKQNKPFNPNYNNDGKKYKRARKIKTAAYGSMARAAGGTRRQWTRAIMWKLRHRKEDNNNNKKGRFLKKRRVSKRDNARGIRLRRSPSEAMKKLRMLVPGGGGMETGSLMEETAHYIKCLSMQVKVMQSLVDRLSP